MKINLILPTPDLSGGWRVFATYAQKLHERGHDVTCVWTVRLLPTLRQKLQSVRRGAGWPRVVREPSHFDQLTLPHVEVSPWRPIRDCDVPDGDVVVASWWETAEWVAGLGRSKGAKAYFIQHHELLFDGVPADPVRGHVALAVAENHDLEMVVDLARDTYGDDDVTLVPNSVDMQQFNAPPRGRQSEPTIGLLYSTTRFKACDVSLKAIDIVRQKFPTLRVIAFGAEPVSERLPLPPNSEFHCRPAQSAIKDLYARCDLWLCGSMSEGFHLPPLEAMACRCPVVSTAVGGSVDVIAENVNGHVVPVGDAEALADRMIRVLSLSPDDWKQMSGAALNTASSYTWDDATTLLEQALESVVTDGAVRRRQLV